MGNNVSSEDAKGAGKDVIKQTEKSSHELYEFVDLTEGGRLVQEFRKAKGSKDFSKVDGMIDGLKKFLYNDGEGKNVPVCDLVDRRRMTRVFEKKKLKQTARSKWRGAHTHTACCCWHPRRKARVNDSSRTSVSLEPLTMNSYTFDETAGECLQLNECNAVF